MTMLRTSLIGLARGILAAGLSMFLAAAALAQAPSADEAKVKAAFLLRFAQFVEWPKDALPGDAPFVIGIAGADAIAAELAQQATASRAALGRPVTIRNAKGGADDARPVHLLFVGAEERLRIAQYAAGVRGRRVLVVTESAGALEQGAMINFVIDDRRVKFEIALEPAERAGLVLSSRLLAVAMRVLKGELDLSYPGYRLARASPRGLER